jgi:hypothetical protein
MSNIDNATPEVKMSRPGGGSDSHNDSYSPVNVSDTVGAIVLGVVSIMLCVVLLSALSRNRGLEKDLALLRQRMLDR